MNDEEDDRLERIETQLRQIKGLLIVLVIIVALGLPSAISTIILLTAGSLYYVLFFIVPILAVCYGIYYGADYLFLRKSREARDQLIEQKLQAELTSLRAEQAASSSQA